MPGILWLSMHSPKTEIFPWWTNYFLGTMLTLSIGFFIFIFVTVIYDWFQ